jgi:hypothetical protein
MEQRTDHYQHDLPPPPPAHQYHPQASQAQDYAYEQQRRPSQQQHYFQQQSSTSSHGYSSPTQDYSTTPYSSQSQSQQQQQHQQQHQQPPSSRHSHKSRTFSFHSDKSHKRTNSKTEEVHETPAEKEGKRLHSKADPTLAISEAEPGMFYYNRIRFTLALLPTLSRDYTFQMAAILTGGTLAVEAAMTQSSLAPLRSLQHRDTFGNPICRSHYSYAYVLMFSRLIILTSRPRQV